MIAAGFDAAGPSRKPVIGAAGAPIAPAVRASSARRCSSPSRRERAGAHTNGKTVSIGGGDDGGISDDDVDVPPFMRH